jgi:iron complex outermembrane receptor protein
MDTEHNFFRPQILGGGPIGEDMDYFVSLSGIFDDGFRDQSHEEVLRGFGNYGIRWNDDNETRIYFTVSDNRLELPGSLTKAQLKADPSKTSGGLFDWQFHNASRNLLTYRGEIKHSILLSENSKLDLGAWYENRDLDHPLPFVIIASESNETGASARYENTTQLFDNDNRFIAGGLWAWGDSEGKNYNTVVFGGGPPTGGDAFKNGLRSTTRNESYTLEWFFENQHALTPELNLVLGTNVVHAKRRNDENIDETNPANSRRFDSGIKKYYTGYSPKAGLVWQASEDIQFFTNASRSYEVPTTFEFDAGVDAGNGKLDAQESITLEIGTRGSYEFIDWDLAFYHAWLHDEILTREDPSSPGQGLAQNVDNTTHLGVELGVNAAIPLGVFGDDSLEIRTVYNFTKFEFDNDSQFGNNKLPSIPENFGTVEVLYQHPSGFYLGPNIQYADNYFVDYANTQKADAYTIYGVRAGYTYNDRYTVYFEGRNLSNRKYISNTGVAFNANGGEVNSSYKCNGFGFKKHLVRCSEI